GARRRHRKIFHRRKGSALVSRIARSEHRAAAMGPQRANDRPAGDLARHMADFTIVIGNKKYSSWSLRGWIMLKHAGVAFDEIFVNLYAPDAKAQILKHSPSGKVPALLHRGATVWESLAIGEYLAELFPERELWPKDPHARAFARSISA